MKFNHRVRASALLLVLVGLIDAGAAASEPAEDDLCAGFDVPNREYWQGTTAGDVGRCLESGALTDVRNEQGETPLHLAVAFNPDERVSERLLDAGADPRARTKSDLTPLHMLAQYGGNPTVAAKLVLKGAEVDSLKDRQPGWWPLYRDRGTSALHFAARHDQTGLVVSALITAEASLGEIDNLGRTALHWAAKYARFSRVIEPLLVNGADPNPADDDGFTPLHVAAQHSAEPLVLKRLLETGADPDLTNSAGYTPLIVAARFSSSVEIFGQLIEATTDPCTTSDDGSDALTDAENNDALRDTPEYWRLHTLCKE